MMRENKKYFIWIGMFLGLLILPAPLLPLLRTVVKGQELTENAEEITRPVLSRETFRTFPDAFEAYYDQNMAFRYQLIEFNGVIDYYLFRDSSSNRVIRGKEGWLFYDKSLAVYDEKNYYTQVELAIIKDQLEEIKDYLDGLGIRLILYIAPNKESVCDRYLPEHILSRKATSATKIAVDYLREQTEITVIFPAEEIRRLAEERPEIPLYYHLDTHWNRLGAYYGSAALLRELGIGTEPSPDIQRLPANSTDGAMIGDRDLVNMLGISHFLKGDVDYEPMDYTSHRVTFRQDIFADRGVYTSYVETVSDADNDLRVVFIRDSFGFSMLPYIGAEVSYMYSPLRTGMQGDRSFEHVMERATPDVVVIEIAERIDLSEIRLKPQF